MDGFNVVVPIEVTFRDLDAMGHASMPMPEGFPARLVAVDGEGAG